MSQERSWGVRIRKLLGIKLGVLFQTSPESLVLAQQPKRSVAGSGDSPSISIVTPSFQQGQFIGRTIRSVLEQGYPQLEYIVQDSCSDDETAEVVSGFESPQLKFYSEKDRGQADAINLGFLKSSGEIMCYLNSDDVLMPGTLARVGAFFKNHPDVEVIYGNRLIINEHDLLVGRWVLPGHDATLLRHVDYVPQETLFWRRSLWARAGGFVDDKLAFALDWDLLLRFVDVDAKFSHLPDFLGAFMVHEAQKTSSHYAQVGVKEMRQMRSRYAPSLYSRLFMPFRHMCFLLKHIYFDRKILRAVASGK